MPRVNGSGFKMKKAPIKNLNNFFSSLGLDKQSRSDRKTKQIQENQGMTNFEKRTADKAADRRRRAKFGGDKVLQGIAERKARRAKIKAKKAATAAGDARNAADKKARLALSAKIKAFEPKKEDKTKPKNKKVEKNVVNQQLVPKQTKTDFTKVKGSSTYVKPKKIKVKSKRKADGTLNLDPVLDLNKKTSKKYKPPKKRANIFSSGLDLTGKYLNKLDRAFGLNVPEFMKKYDK